MVASIRAMLYGVASMDLDLNSVRVSRASFGTPMVFQDVTVIFAVNVTPSWPKSLPPLRCAHCTAAKLRTCVNSQPLLTELSQLRTPAGLFGCC
jgi:hypothetical protein